MPKIKPERVAGIVALSYLVLIPAGAFLAWRKILIIDQDVTAMWDKMDPAMRPDHEARIDPFKSLREALKGWSVR